jgi:hypothetical protein
VLAHPVDAVTPRVSLPSVDVSSDLQLVAATHVEEPVPVEALTLEHQLATAFKVLHCLDMAEKSRSLSKEELDLVEFLVAPIVEFLVRHGRFVELFSSMRSYHCRVNDTSSSGM